MVTLAGFAFEHIRPHKSNIPHPSQDAIMSKCYFYEYFNLTVLLLIRKLYFSYTPKAVVIDNHLPRQPLISSYVPD